MYKLPAHFKDLCIHFLLLLFQAEPACQLTDHCVAGSHWGEKRKTSGNCGSSLDAACSFGLALCIVCLFIAVFLNKEKTSGCVFKGKEADTFLIAVSCVFVETWSRWQPWSPCSVTCGDGIRERFRECLTSSPAKPGCAGSPKETSLCSLEECVCM